MSPLTLLLALLLPVAAQPAPPRAVAYADTAHGVVILDEYRWMEAVGAALDPWVDAEDAHARATLDALPGRTALRARIVELWQTGVGDVDEDVIDTQAGQTLVKDFSLGHARLGIHDGDGPLRVLFNPQTDGPEQGKGRP